MCGLRGIFRYLHFPLRTGLNQLIDHLHFRVRILARRDRDRSGRLVLFECDAIDAQGHLAHIQIAARGKVLANGLANRNFRILIGAACKRRDDQNREQDEQKPRGRTERSEHNSIIRNQSAPLPLMDAFNDAKKEATLMRSRDESARAACLGGASGRRCMPVV